MDTEEMTVCTVNIYKQQLLKPMPKVMRLARNLGILPPEFLGCVSFVCSNFSLKAYEQEKCAYK